MEKLLILSLLTISANSWAAGPTLAELKCADTLTEDRAFEIGVEHFAYKENGAYFVAATRKGEDPRSFYIVTSSSIRQCFLKEAQPYYSEAGKFQSYRIQLANSGTDKPYVDIGFWANGTMTHNLYTNNKHDEGRKYTPVGCVDKTDSAETKTLFKDLLNKTINSYGDRIVGSISFSNHSGMLRSSGGRDEGESCLATDLGKVVNGKLQPHNGNYWSAPSKKVCDGILKAVNDIHKGCKDIEGVKVEKTEKEFQDRFISRVDLSAPNVGTPPRGSLFDAGR